MPKNKEQAQETKQESPELKFWRTAAEKGYANFFILAKSEDLSNPDPEYITIGWKDANGLSTPALTAPKSAWIATAKLILAKYGNGTENK